MRDCALITDVDNKWYIDIDIVNGQPVYLIDDQTNDQRAAVASVQAKGTIPGMLETGVDWAQMYVKEYQDGLVNIDNQIKQNIQDTAYADGGVMKQYTPLFAQTEEGIKFGITKVGAEVIG